MTPLSEEQIRLRQQKLLRREWKQPLRYWYLSFAGADGFRGAVVVKAQGILTAVAKAWKLRINPGGEVAAQPVPRGVKVPKAAVDRLLSAEELEKYWGKVGSFVELGKQEKED